MPTGPSSITPVTTPSWSSFAALIVLRLGELTYEIDHDGRLVVGGFYGAKDVKAFCWLHDLGVTPRSAVQAADSSVPS
jgi:hypothetical protein